MAVRWDRGSPALLPAIVCFADILGFRAKTKCALQSGQEEEFLRRIKGSLRKAYDLVRRDRTLDGAVPPIFDMKVFTDNIVVAHPLRDLNFNLGEPEFFTLLTLFAEVQANLASDGFFLRGAIAAGNHYQDDDIAFGKPLLEAVDLDESGGPPRLVIAPSVESLIAIQLTSYGDGGRTPHHSLLLEDSRDERLFVNYLEWTAFGNFPDGPIDYEFLKAHREHVRAGLEENESNSHVREKYEWLATYHNFVCRKFADRYPDQYSEWADDEQSAIAEEARCALNHLIPDEEFPPKLRPRRLEAQRLCQRLGVSWPIKHL